MGECVDASPEAKAAMTECFDASPYQLVSAISLFMWITATAILILISYASCINRTTIDDEDKLVLIRRQASAPTLAAVVEDLSVANLPSMAETGRLHVASGEVETPCIVCYDNMSELPCGRLDVCEGCLEEYIERACETRPKLPVILCPTGCGKPLSLSTIRDYVPDWVPADVYLKCIACDIRAPHINTELYQRTCFGCSTRWCGVCGTPLAHEEHTCPTREEEGVRLNIVYGQVQLCSCCPAPMQKSNGCSQIVCLQCRTAQRWVGA